MFMIVLAVGLAAMQSGEGLGSFHHGQWRGEYFRDGFLAGMDDEVCRARWSGNMDVSFDRNADRLTLLLRLNDSSKPECSESASFRNASLAKRGREIRILAYIRSQIREIARRRTGPTHFTPVSAKDLKAALRETDDLAHIP